MGRHPRRGAPMANVKPIPDGYPQVTPYLAVDDANAAIDFYTTVFGARERMRMDAPGGKVGHAELQFGDSLVMLADEFPEMGHRWSISTHIEDVPPDEMQRRAAEMAQRMSEGAGG